MSILGYFEQDSECGENDLWERSGSVSYRLGSTQQWSVVKVKQNLGPGFAIGTIHPDDPGMVITNVSCKRIFEEGPSLFANPLNPLDPAIGKDCYWYTVDATYGPWDPLTHTASGNPVDMPVDFAFQWQVGEQPCEVAITGRNPDGSYILSPVLNSANCPFDPGITRDELRCILRISHNVLTYSPSTEWALGNCINNDTWNGFAAGTVKWTPPDMPQRLYSQVVGNYYRLDHQFNFNPQGWRAKPIDRGFSAMNPEGYPEKILDAFGQPVSEPVLLDGSGNRLLNPTPDNIKIFDFQTCNDVSFVDTFGPTFNNLFPS